MKGIKKGLLAGMALCCMPMLTACSFKETLKVLWNSEDKETEKDGEKSENKLDAAKIDPNVAVPVITGEFGEPSVYEQNIQADPLTVQASVTDQGKVTYQWYRNNVDSNGGGTEIAGAVEQSFIPPTAELGTSYYYVVVTNRVGDGIQLTVSATKCVTVVEPQPVELTPSAEVNYIESDGGPGNWVVNENGRMFMYADGSYAVSKWEIVEHEQYLFDENGYVRKGWHQEGEVWRFFTEDGIMLHDTVIDGYQLGPDGVRQ